MDATPLMTINKSSSKETEMSDHFPILRVASGTGGRLVAIGVVNVFVVLNICLLFTWTGANQNSSDPKNSQGYSFDPNSGRFLNLHKVFMVLGFCILPTNAYLIYRYRIIRLKRLFVKIIHAILMLLSTLFGIAGLGIIVKQIEVWKIDHFSDLHTWFGLLTLIMSPLQWLVGFVVFLLPLDFKHSHKEAVLLFHRFVGGMMIILPTITALLGIYASKSTPIYGAHNLVGEFLGLFLFLQAVLVAFLLYGPGSLILKPIKNE